MVMDTSSALLVSPEIFEHLQSKIDEDARVRDQLRDILQDLDKQGTSTLISVARVVQLTSSREGLAVYPCTSTFHGSRAAQVVFKGAFSQC